MYHKETFLYSIVSNHLLLLTLKKILLIFKVDKLCLSILNCCGDFALSYFRSKEFNILLPCL